LRLPSRLVIAPPAGVDPLAALGGAALAGAGLVLARASDDGVGVIPWIRAHSAAAVGIRPEDGARADDVQRAAEAGYDVLAVPATSTALAHWPSDRPVLALITASLDAEGSDGDLLLERLSELSSERVVLAGVTAPPGPEGDALVAQLLTCDRIKQEAGLATALLGTVPNADVAATAVLAGRADLVQGVLSLVSEDWRPGNGVRVGAPLDAAPRA